MLDEIVKLPLFHRLRGDSNGLHARLLRPMLANIRDEPAAASAAIQDLTPSETTWCVLCIRPSRLTAPRGGGGEVGGGGWESEAVCAQLGAFRVVECLLHAEGKQAELSLPYKQLETIRLCPSPPRHTTRSHSADLQATRAHPTQNRLDCMHTYPSPPPPRSCSGCRPHLGSSLCGLPSSQLAVLLAAGCGVSLLTIALGDHSAVLPREPHALHALQLLQAEEPSRVAAEIVEAAKGGEGKAAELRRYGEEEGGGVSAGSNAHFKEKLWGVGLRRLLAKDASLKALDLSYLPPGHPPSTPLLAAAGAYAQRAIRAQLLSALRQTECPIE
ncbi:MAG: hypothetical protein SGPRY_009478, partial [Prymnesium sp.]